jgi:Transmembrane secretion effector
LAQAFGGPAYQALIPSLVKREDMPNAIALNSIHLHSRVRRWRSWASSGALA